MYCVAIFLHKCYCVERFAVVFPLHRSCGSQGGFVDLSVRWSGSDATEINFFAKESIHAAEEGTHILCAAHIVENHPNRLFLQLFVIQKARTL